ncbi:MAG: AGE family epimerase/isomerase [Pseudomonadota bacterium]|nr:AGE family epimerase/isomerase [Pseudomonadota bacterium]
MHLPDFDRARQWMFQSALPFWAHAGVDPAHGGFHEALDLKGRPARGGFRRLRVTCRQIYVFSHAATLGWDGGLPVARLGFEYLLSRGWMGPDKGWARRLTPCGKVLDATPDLYDHAFVLFALGWLHRANLDPEALVWAHRTLDFLEAHMRHPSGLGFLHSRPARGWRLQNPHMHLLEAALVLYETSGHARFAALAGEIVTLFTTHFFDPRTGTLGESFTEDLARAPGEDGRLTEPGHQFEWAWILASYQRLLGEPVGDVARSLVAFGELHGVDRATGATYNCVRDDGTALDRGSRTWPNTERIKAHIALFELHGTDPCVPLAQSTRLLLERYLAHRPAGTWLDHFDGDGQPIAVTIPTATLYHLFVAFAELLRVEPALRALAHPQDRRATPRALAPLVIRDRVGSLDRGKGGV